VSRQETPEQAPAERQGETKGEAVLVLLAHVDRGRIGERAEPSFPDQLLVTAPSRPPNTV